MDPISPFIVHKTGTEKVYDTQNHNELGVKDKVEFYCVITSYLDILNRWTVGKVLLLLQDVKKNNTIMFTFSITLLQGPCDSLKDPNYRIPFSLFCLTLL